MKLDPLLFAAAVLHGVAGLAMTFAPDEVVALLGGASGTAVWVGKLLGAALLGLASLNWLQRHARVGGVLGRPVLLANLMFATVAFWGTVSAWRHDGGGALLVAGLVLGGLSAAFGARLFGVGARQSGAPDR